jgi:hypothetical protein
VLHDSTFNAKLSTDSCAIGFQQLLADKGFSTAPPKKVSMSGIAGRNVVRVDGWRGASAHPFNWTPRFFNKILAKVDAAIATSATLKTAA